MEIYHHEELRLYEMACSTLINSYQSLRDSRKRDENFRQMGQEDKSLLQSLNSHKPQLKNSDTNKIYKRLKRTEGNTRTSPLNKEQQVNLLLGL